MFHLFLSCPPSSLFSTQDPAHNMLLLKNYPSASHPTQREKSKVLTKASTTCPLVPVTVVSLLVPSQAKLFPPETQCFPFPLPGIPFSQVYMWPSLSVSSDRRGLPSPLYIKQQPIYLSPLPLFLFFTALSTT